VAKVSIPLDHSTSGLAHGTSEASPKTRIESVYRRLRQDIISGVYAPGEKLRIDHLRERYQVGGSTMREALGRLVADTLVYVQGQRGFRVAPISLNDFEDITNSRILLETEAVRLSIEHGGEIWESEVVAAHHRLSRTEEKMVANPQSAVDEYEERNLAFHTALISACPSVWLRHFLSILWKQSERYRRLSIEKHPIPRDVAKEHAQILEAVLARDAKRAVQLTAEHIRLTLEAIRRLSPANGNKQKLSTRKFR
jgi:GntR family transcriptional regulator, carbon starvation induced regulator